MKSKFQQLLNILFILFLIWYGKEYLQSRKKSWSVKYCLKLLFNLFFVKCYADFN